VSHPRLRTGILALAFALGCTAPAIAKDRHALWTIEGERNTVYLLGSIHVLRPGDGGLPPALQQAYADAEQLVMEIDFDDPAVADPVALLGAMRTAAALPPGTTLRAVLGPDLPLVESRLQEAGLDLDLFEGQAPWLLAVTLLQVELARRGFDPTLGTEQRLAAQAATDGKPIAGLETPAQQFGVLAGLSLPQQKRFLLMTLDETDDLDEQVDELLGAWRRGDVAGLARTLSDEYERFPELYGPLTVDRNRAWVPQIESLLDDADDYLVVVGALHLVGRDSVVDLLRQRGHQVEQQ
jgi:uncharacterized protein YbaP (TraB family)